MTIEIQALRREVERHERARGRRYPAELKQRVTAAARKLRALGWTYKAAADELGLVFETLRRWVLAEERVAARPRRSSSSAIVPVRIVSRAPPAARATISPCLVVSSPRGWRIEGLELADAITMLERLG